MRAMPSPAPPSPAPSPVPGQLRRRGFRPAGRNPHDAEILRLAGPAFGALVAEPLFLFADSVIVGRLGTAPLGGLGVASQALTTLVGISIFLAYGTTAAVARQLGAGHGWPLAPQIVHAFGGSPAVTREAATYLRISLLGAPSMLMVLAGTGVLRGLQDTRTPLTVAVAANVVNVALNAFLVLGLHWGIAGSAWGTVCAQTAAAAAYLAWSPARFGASPAARDSFVITGNLRPQWQPREHHRPLPSLPQGNEDGDFR